MRLFQPQRFKPVLNRALLDNKCYGILIVLDNGFNQNLKYSIFFVRIFYFNCSLLVYFSQVYFLFSNYFSLYFSFRSIASLQHMASRIAYFGFISIAIEMFFDVFYYSWRSIGFKTHNTNHLTGFTTRTSIRIKS